MVKKKLFVGNLPNNFECDTLRQAFEHYGTVAECDVLRNYGFVHMLDEEEALRAVSALHHSMMGDCKVNVQFSTTEVHKNPGVGSKGECFRCGQTGHFSRECPTNTDGAGQRGRRKVRGSYPGASRGRGGGRGRGYSNGHSEYYPQPPRDGYYDYYDEYYRRPIPPPGYGYRERSRSPTLRRPVTPPGYRRRYSPTREYYERYYERIPERDPYYEYARRPSPVRRPPPEEYRRVPEEYRRPAPEEYRERQPLPRDLEYYRRLEGKRPPPAAERETTHYSMPQGATGLNFTEDVNF